MPETGHTIDFMKAKDQAQAMLKGSGPVHEAQVAGQNALNCSIELTLQHKLQQGDKRRTPQEQQQ